MKTVNEIYVSNDQSKSNEPSWFTLAKENIANEKQQCLIKKELETIQKEEEKVIKLRERAKAVKMSKENKVENQKPASWKELPCNKNLEDLKMDVEEDELLIREFESDQSDSENEDFKEISVR